VDVVYKIQIEHLSESYLERLLHGKGLHGASVTWEGPGRIRIANVPMGTDKRLLEGEIERAERQRLRWCVRFRKELGRPY
jgi:hypothetical protein